LIEECARESITAAIAGASNDGGGDAAGESSNGEAIALVGGACDRDEPRKDARELECDGEEGAYGGGFGRRSRLREKWLRLRRVARGR
jgi:hypothetical protein